MSKLIWFSVFLLVVLISQTDKVESSYAGSASAIINPSKVKQISWNPRSLSLSISLSSKYLPIKAYL
jgi:prolyl 4-hydroxylase